MTLDEILKAKEMPKTWHGEYIRIKAFGRKNGIIVKKEQYLEFKQQIIAWAESKVPEEWYPTTDKATTNIMAEGFNDSIKQTKENIRSEA